MRLWLVYPAVGWEARGSEPLLLSVRYKFIGEGGHSSYSWLLEPGPRPNMPQRRGTLLISQTPSGIVPN